MFLVLNVCTVIPQINVIVVVIATITVYYIAFRNMGAFLNVFAKPGRLNLVSMDYKRRIVSICYWSN